MIPPQKLSAAAFAALVPLALAVPANAAVPVTVSFSSPGDQTWTVPAGVTKASFAVDGAAGGGTVYGGQGQLSSPGGKGAHVVGTIAVTPGEQLKLTVAGAGTSNTVRGSAGAGGFGGGGSAGPANLEDLGGGGGGGASTVARDATPLLVAGGGGGAPTWGGAGGNSGAAGSNDGSTDAGAGGAPGTASAGGAGGAGGVYPQCPASIAGATGDAGSSARGGAGARSTSHFSASGGGGGGGFYGGGGGGSGQVCGSFSGSGGGGGGSSFLAADVTHGSVTDGARSGDGVITITYGDTVAPTAAPVVPSGWQNEAATVSWNWSDTGGVGLDPAACPATTTSSGQGEQELTARCSDLLGNEGSASETVKVDTEAPTIGLDVAKEYTQGDKASAEFSCDDATSGVATCESSGPLDTGALGEHTFSVDAVDKAGNEAHAEATYTVVAPPVVVQDEPPADTPPAAAPPAPAPAAPAPVAVLPAAIAPSLDGADPLVFRPSARVTCRTATGSLNGCKVRVTAHGKLIASGSGRGSGEAVAVKLRLTAYGRRVLGRTLGGVGARVQASTAGRSWTVKRRALNATERFVTPAGSFAANEAELTPVGKRFVARMTARLRAVRGARCDGYSAGDTIARSNALNLSRDRAKTVCAGLSGARIVGHGTSDPIAANRSDAGRAKNRRVVVTVRH